MKPACKAALATLPAAQGKNKPSRRQKKRQLNIVEERKPLVKQRMREQVGGGCGRPGPGQCPALHCSALCIVRICAFSMHKANALPWRPR